MARIFCKYHPTVPARWTCRACGINFCRRCMQAEGSDTPHCPVCHQAAESLGKGNVIEPFWQRLQAIFAWPLQWPPLLFMLGLTVLGVLVEIVAGRTRQGIWKRCRSPGKPSPPNWSCPSSSSSSCS